MKSIAVLGATGSIGLAALDLIGKNPEGYRVTLLAAGCDHKALAALAIKHRPRHVALMDAAGIAPLKQAFADANLTPTIHPTIHHGMADLCAVLKEEAADITINAISGSDGLLPSLAVIQGGGVLALANKESLVAAGSVLMAEAKRHNTTILPIDSEHNAIFQLWNEAHTKTLTGISLTASGGALRDLHGRELAEATPAMALRHPNWQMGQKITIDSATLMNKGLEVIEACVLFGLDEAAVEVVVHRQSVIHGMLHYADGSTLAYLARADMRVPLSYVLAYPQRLTWDAGGVDLLAAGRLDFEALDNRRFPAVELARAAWRAGGFAPTILNAANEVAVAGFLARRIGFLDIVGCVADVLAHMPNTANISNASGVMDMEAVLAVHAHSTRVAEEWVTKHGQGHSRSRGRGNSNSHGHGRGRGKASVAVSSPASDLCSAE